MMAGNLSIEQGKWILKQYWKPENAERVGTAEEPPILYTIYCILTFGPTLYVRNKGRQVFITR